MTELDRLTAIEAIKTVMYKRIRCVDTKNWAEYDTCHTVDAASESYGDFPDTFKPKGSGRAEGKAAIMDMIRRIVDGPIKLSTIHHALHPEIGFLSDDMARGRWVLEDRLFWEHDGVVESFHGWGAYEELYEKVGNEWLIKFRKVIRLRAEHTPGYFRIFEMNAQESIQ